MAPRTEELVGAGTAREAVGFNRTDSRTTTRVMTLLFDPDQCAPCADAGRRCEQACQAVLAAIG